MSIRKKNKNPVAGDTKPASVETLRARLRRLAQANDTTVALFGYLSEMGPLRGPHYESTLSRIRLALEKDGERIINLDFFDAFRELQTIGVGINVLGIRQRPVAFRWYYHPASVAEVALGLSKELRPSRSERGKFQPLTPKDQVKSTLEALTPAELTKFTKDELIKLVLGKK